MHIHELASWAEFDEVVAHGGPYSSWAFRGQENAAWPIRSSLERHLTNFNVSRLVWPMQEARIIRIFKRKAHLHLASPPPDLDDLQWLSLIQHHGGPTRLIDFTWSPYVAAFFALQTATSECAVFAVDPKRFPDLPTLPGVGARTSPREDGVFQELFLPGTSDVVTLGEPRLLNARLSAQVGTFVIPGNLDTPVDTLIDRSCGGGSIAKLVIPQSARRTAMRSLYDRNISTVTLFPDLAGLAESLRYELETHWAYDPITGDRVAEFARHPPLPLLSTT